MAAGIGRPLGPLGPKPQVCGAEKGAAGPSPRGLTNVPSWLQAQQVCVSWEVQGTHQGSQEETQAGVGEHNDEFVSLPAKRKVPVGCIVENAQ